MKCKPVDIIEQCKDTTLIKPSAMLKALTLFAQANEFVQPITKYGNMEGNYEQALEKFDNMLQHQNMFEWFSEDADYVDFRWENPQAETGDLDEIIFTIHLGTYMPDTTELDTLNQFDIEKAVFYLYLSSWVTIGIKGEDYPLEYDMQDIVYTVEKHYNILDK